MEAEERVLGAGAVRLHHCETDIERVRQRLLEGVPQACERPTFLRRCGDTVDVEQPSWLQPNRRVIPPLELMVYLQQPIYTAQPYQHDDYPSLLVQLLMLSTSSNLTSLPDRSKARCASSTNMQRVPHATACVKTRCWTPFSSPFSLNGSPSFAENAPEER